jgi:hypothetical protein
LEVLFALVLLSVGLMAVFRLQTSNLEVQSEARFLTESGCALQGQCAELLSRSGYREGVHTGSWKEEHPGLSYREEIAQVPGRKHLYKARVRLFQDPPGPSRSLVIETYLWSAGE